MNCADNTSGKNLYAIPTQFFSIEHNYSCGLVTYYRAQGLLIEPKMMHKEYSETCSCDHLYSESDHLVVSQLWHVFLPLLRDHLYSKTTFFLAQAWSLNTNFNVLFFFLVRKKQQKTAAADRVVW